MNKVAFVLAIIALAACSHLYYIANEHEALIYNEKEMSYSMRRTIERIGDCKFQFVTTYPDWEVEGKAFLCIGNTNS